jgi:hypothetical protein
MGSCRTGSLAGWSQAQVDPSSPLRNVQWSASEVCPTAPLEPVQTQGEEGRRLKPTLTSTSLTLPGLGHSSQEVSVGWLFYSSTSLLPSSSGFKVSRRTAIVAERDKGWGNSYDPMKQRCCRTLSVADSGQAAGPGSLCIHIPAIVFLCPKYHHPIFGAKECFWRDSSDDWDLHCMY